MEQNFSVNLLPFVVSKNTGKMSSAGEYKSIIFYITSYFFYFVAFDLYLGC